MVRKIAVALLSISVAGMIAQTPAARPMLSPPSSAARRRPGPAKIAAGSQASQIRTRTTTKNDTGQPWPCGGQ